jgi:copper homeostasis protein (lipoprotein)
MTGRHLVRALAISLACVVSVHGSAAAQIRGTATFRERIALPAEALFDATLEDVSSADAPSIVLGRARIRGPGQPPIRFQIPFDAARIDPGHRYVVRARILVGTRPMFTTDQSYPVLTGGNGRQVALLLHRSTATDPTTTESAERGTAPLGSRSAIFTGNLPCADCTAVRYQLELFPDETYFLRRTYVGGARGGASDDIGRWVLSRDGRTLTLFGGLDVPLRIAIGNPNTLHVLGAPDDAVAARRDNALRLTTSAQPLEPRLRMRGMYRNVADAGRFTECRTRQSWPVAQERDNLALEAAYARARRSPGDAVLVEVVGRVALRPGADGGDRERTLVVERFSGARPGESCSSQRAAVPPEDTRTATPLENTHWTLARVGDSPVRAEGQREPHLILHSATRRVSGAATCNRLLGRYEVEDTSLTFSEVASSRMACPTGMDVERRFLAALRASRTARVRGRNLELFDANGRFLARLEARQAN